MPDVVDPPVLVNERITEFAGWDYENLTAPVPDNDYGYDWPPNTSQYTIELYGYSVGGLAGRSAFYHMVNCIRLDLPSVEFTKDGYINSTFLRCIKACCEHPDLAIAGAASSGKTFPVSCWVLQDWKSAPNKTLTFVCTTSMGAAEDRIWGAIVKRWQEAKFKIGDYIPHKYCIAWGKFSEDASDREYNSAIKALAIERGSEGEKAIDTTRGRKQKHVRIVFDELPEMGGYVMRACVNLESNPDFRSIGIGNPAKHDDAHGELCKPDDPRGYKAVNRFTPEWKTRTGWCIFMNGEWSPNFEAPSEDQIPFPYLTNRLTLAKMLNRCHGNSNSIEYFRNAIGFWPEVTTIETVLTIDLILQHKANEKIKWSGSPRKKLCGFDAAFTLGGDLCVAQFGDLGFDVDGRYVLQWDKEEVFAPSQNGIFEEEVAKWLVDMCIASGVRPEALGMDIGGDGGKIMREIIRYWYPKNKDAANVFPISSMGRATERQVSSIDPRKCSDVYDRRVTEYWLAVREAVLTQVIKNLPVDPNSPTENEMIQELCARTYSVVNKTKLSIETKREFKERLKHSPDKSDAFCYLTEMARRNGLVFKSPEKDKERKERRDDRKRDTNSNPWTSYGEDSWGEDESEAKSVNSR